MHFYLHQHSNSNQWQRRVTHLHSTSLHNSHISNADACNRCNAIHTRCVSTKTSNYKSANQRTSIALIKKREKRGSERNWFSEFRRIYHHQPTPSATTHRHTKRMEKGNKIKWATEQWLAPHMPQMCVEDANVFERVGARRRKVNQFILISPLVAIKNKYMFDDERNR